jgi:hypothetical protein
VLAGFFALARHVGEQTCGAVENVAPMLPPPAETPLDQLAQPVSSPA